MHLGTCSSSPVVALGCPGFPCGQEHVNDPKSLRHGLEGTSGNSDWFKNLDTTPLKRNQNSGWSFLQKAVYNYTYRILWNHKTTLGPFWDSLMAHWIKNPPAKARDAGSVPELEGSPGEGNGNPLQSSCLGNPTDRRAWRATVQRVAKSQTWLSN